MKIREFSLVENWEREALDGSGPALLAAQRFAATVTLLHRSGLLHQAGKPLAQSEVYAGKAGPGAVENRLFALFAD